MTKFEQIAYEKLLKIIDSRVQRALAAEKMLQELPAVVQSVSSTDGTARVSLRGDVQSEITLINKSGEVLTAGDSVFVSWRGTLSAATAYISRRAGSPVYPAATT
jgi:hypothetical protein